MTWYQRLEDSICVFSSPRSSRWIGAKSGIADFNNHQQYSNQANIDARISSLGVCNDHEPCSLCVCEIIVESVAAQEMLLVGSPYHPTLVDGIFKAHVCTGEPYFHSILWLMERL